MPVIRLETVIPAPPEACFELSLSVDAHTASMGPSRERAVAGVTRGVLRLGDTVTWQGSHFGLPFRLTSRITEYDPPRRFVDEQVRGPFARWHHEHLFEKCADGTRMIDVASYASPAGPLGRLVDRILLERYMTRLLVQRNAWLRETLSA